MIEDDELDNMIMAEPSERERVKMHHEFMHKAASHPVRRQLIKKIGVFGATKEEVMESIEIDDNAFKYHTDFMINGDLMNIIEGKYSLTEKGMEILETI